MNSRADDILGQVADSVACSVKVLHCGDNSHIKRDDEWRVLKVSGKVRIEAPSTFIMITDNLSVEKVSSSSKTVVYDLDSGYPEHEGSVCFVESAPINLSFDKQNY